MTKICKTTQDYIENGNKKCQISEENKRIRAT